MLQPRHNAGPLPSDIINLLALLARRQTLHAARPRLSSQLGRGLSFERPSQHWCSMCKDLRLALLAASTALLLAASFSARALLLALTYFDIGKYAATNRWHACGAQEKPGSYGRRSCRVSLNCVARNLRRARPAVPHHSCDTACASCVALSNYSAAIARVNYSYLMNLSRVNAKPSPLTNCY
jgi:hypothetical protein